MKIKRKNIIRPKALRIGDTIGIVAPAGPFDKNQFNDGIKIIHEMGFSTKFDDGIYKRNDFLAGDDQHRATQLNMMMADEHVHAVMCARGGYGTLRVLDHVDYEAISKHPKPLIGFSDITALHRAIFLKNRLITFHGPMVTTLPRSDQPTVQSWYDFLMGECNFSAILSQLRVLKSGVAEGVLVGGNLATLCHLTGTSFGDDFSGTILFLEDVTEVPYRVDRMLTQMKMAGILDGVKGVILGSFEDCGPVEKIQAVFVDRFHGTGIPIVSGAPVGHGHCNLTLPLGVRVRLDTYAPEFRLLEPVFEDNH